MPSLAVLKGFNFSASLSAHIFSIKKDYNCHAPGSQCSFNLHFPKDWVVLRIFGETSIPYLCLFLIFCSCSCWVARPWLLNLIWVWKPPLKWQLTPVFLLGESHGHSSLVGYSPRGRTESDTTECLSMVVMILISVLVMLGCYLTVVVLPWLVEKRASSFIQFLTNTNYLCFGILSDIKYTELGF